MNAAELLCSGTPGGFGGLSNEKELAKMCPEEFKKGNRWTKIVVETYLECSKRTRIAFKTDDMRLREKQWDCFVALKDSFDIGIEDKIAVLGWMLSEWTLIVEPNSSVRN